MSLAHFSGCLKGSLKTPIPTNKRKPHDRRQNLLDAKTFLKQLRATLKQQGFQRLNANNYFYCAEFLLCLFTIQKSMYGGQYYFDVYYRLADRTLRRKTTTPYALIGWNACLRRTLKPYAA